MTTVETAPAAQDSHQGPKLRELGWRISMQVAPVYPSVHAACATLRL
jgi:hypothetical protein